MSFPLLFGRARPPRGWRGALAAASVLALAAAPASSVGGPPLVTEGPGTPGPGVWEINLATVLEDVAASRLLAAPVLDLNYGWGERVQLKLEIPWLMERVDGTTEDGLGSWELGVKWRFLESARGRLRASLYPQAEVEGPGTAKDFAGSAFELPVQIAASLAMLDLSAELGYAVRDGEPDEWLAGIAAALPLDQGVSLVGEVYGRHGADIGERGEETVVAANLGAVWRITAEANVLASVGRALRRAESVGPRLTAYLGLQLLR